MKLIQDTITSRKNPLVMLAASLSDKKSRDENGMFLAEGIKLCREAISAHAPICYVFFSESLNVNRRTEILGALADGEYTDTVVASLSESCFEKISTEKSPEGIILVIKHLDISKKIYKIDNECFGRADRAVLLCSVRDPGNLGTILRSAGAFGVATVILTEDCADVYNPRTVRAAMGAVFRVATLRITDVGASIAALRAMGRRVLSAELRERAVPLSAIQPCGDDVFVIGNEGHGIPESVSLACDGSVYIPIAAQAESLNAAVAAAVLLWEQSKG